MTSSYRGKVVNGECPECGAMLYPGEINKKYCNSCDSDLTIEQEVFA